VLGDAAAAVWSAAAGTPAGLVAAGGVEGELADQRVVVEDRATLSPECSTTTVAPSHSRPTCTLCRPALTSPRALTRISVQVSVGWSSRPGPAFAEAV